MNENILKLFQERFKDEQIKTNEPMSLHTTFKIGGPADLFVAPKNEEDLLFTLNLCNENKIPCLILGNGSNMLVSDKGIRGVVVSMLSLDQLKLLDDYTIYAQSGVSMKALAEFASNHAITGFESLHGIPGSIGGGIFMNAGAYEGEVGDVFISACCIDENNNIIDIDSQQMNFGYRKSLAQTKGLIIASTTLKGKKGNKAQILAKMAELEEKRSSKQPIDMPSAGSIFKRPPGYFAGKLISDAGLRGHCIGDAQVSEKHCGFIVNKGNATSSDVLALISHIQQAIKAEFDVLLETEVKMIGEE